MPENARMGFDANTDIDALPSLPKADAEAELAAVARVLKSQQRYAQRMAGIGHATALKGTGGSVNAPAVEAARTISRARVESLQGMAAACPRPEPSVSLMRPREVAANRLREVRDMADRAEAERVRREGRLSEVMRRSTDVRAARERAAVDREKALLRQVAALGQRFEAATAELAAERASRKRIEERDRRRDWFKTGLTVISVVVAVLSATDVL